MTTRRYRISGRVQGVGFRWFVEREATRIGVSGWVRNLDDGRVEVLATGSKKQLGELLARLYQGPRAAEVRGIEESEAEPSGGAGFSIR
jgi:acylphosphatase